MSLKTLRRYLLITAGCAVYALAFNWCYAPNNIAYGGSTGVAQIIHAFLGFPSIGALVFCMNVPLFLLAVAPVPICELSKALARRDGSGAGNRAKPAPRQKTAR